MRKHWWFVAVGVAAFVVGLVVMRNLVDVTSYCGRLRDLTSPEKVRCDEQIDAAFMTRWGGFFLAVGGLMLAVYGLGLWQGRRSRASEIQAPPQGD